MGIKSSIQFYQTPYMQFKFVALRRKDKLHIGIGLDVFKTKIQNEILIIHKWSTCSRTIENF